MTIHAPPANRFAPALDRAELASWRLDSEGVDLVGSLRSLAAVVGLTCGAASVAANVLDTWGSVVGVAVGVLFPALFVLVAELGHKVVALVTQRGQAGQVRLVRLGVVVIGLTAAVVSFNHVQAVLGSHIKPGWFSWAAAIVIDIGAVVGLIAHHMASVQLKRHRIATRVLDELAADDAAARAAEERAEAERQRAQAEADRQAAEIEAERQAAAAERRKARAAKGGKKTTAQKVAAALERDPHATQQEIADRLKVSVSTVRRYWPRPALAAAPDDVEAQEVDTTADVAA